MTKLSLSFGESGFEQVGHIVSFASLRESVSVSTFSFRSLFIPNFMCRTENLREIGGFQDLPVAWGTDDITWFWIAKNTFSMASTPPLISVGRRLSTLPHAW